MKLTKDIEGCSGKEIHPRIYKKGEDCPADLVDAAIALGALPEKEAKSAKAKAEADAAAKLEAEKADADEKADAESAETAKAAAEGQA